MSTQKRNSKILFLAVIFFWYAQYVYIPFQTPYLTGIGVTAGMIGTIIGAYGISQMLLRFPVGIMADCKNQHKLFIIIGGVSSGTASLLRIFFQSGTGFLTANLFSGLASAMWISFMVFYMGFFPGEQKRAASQLVLANNVGMLLGFITSTCFYEKLGMPVICLFSVIAGFLCAFISLGLKEEKEIQETKRLPVGELVKVCASKRLLLVSLLALVQQGVQMSTTMSFTTQIIKNMGADTFVVGMASIIYMVSAVSWAKFASTKLCGKLSTKAWITICFVVTALYCILVPVAGSIAEICILQILPGMSTGILFSFLTSEAMVGVPPEKKSTAMGFYQAVYALGITVFPMISGKIVGAWSMSYAYFALAGVCFVAAIGSRFIKDVK